jgi:hypothetical protein
MKEKTGSFLTPEQNKNWNAVVDIECLVERGRKYDSKFKIMVTEVVENLPERFLYILAGAIHKLEDKTTYWTDCDRTFWRNNVQQGSSDSERVKKDVSKVVDFLINSQEFTSNEERDEFTIYVKDNCERFAGWFLQELEYGITQMELYLTRNYI